MKRKSTLISAIALTVLFVVCLLLPVIQFVFDNRLNGAEAFALNFGRLFLVQDYAEYLQVMSTVLTNFFVLVLVIWSYRERVKLVPVLILSTLSLATALVWVIKYFEKDVLLYGYWVWIAFIVLLIGFHLYKYKNQRVLIS